MFKILDNRNQFYQWDIDRIIVVEDDTINQVHFCNRTDDCSLVCEVYELDGMRVVNVPNILLQDDWKINVYGYDKNYTKFSDTFEVVRRTKPTDYVYTETETVNYNTLLEKMNNIDETIEGTVEKYLDENPPQVDFTGYATEEYVDNAISAIPEVDLSAYALKTDIPSTTGLATEKYVDDAIAGIDIPDTDLTGYATEKYVDDAIAAIDLPDPTVAASGVTFDDTAAGIGAANVQEAIEYLADSGITSEVVQEQIDENRFWGSATLFDLISGANVPDGVRLISVSNPTELFSTLRQKGACSWYITSSANKPTYKQLYNEGYRYVLYCLGSSITMDRALSAWKDSDSTWDLPAYGNSIYQWGNALVVAHSKLDFKKAISKIYYDNSTSGLKATTLPGAIDELAEKMSTMTSFVDGNEVSY